MQELECLAISPSQLWQHQCLTLATWVAPYAKDLNLSYMVRGKWVYVEILFAEMSKLWIFLLFLTATFI